MSRSGDSGMHARQRNEGELPPGRPKTVREPWHRPKYKGDFAFKLEKDGGLKQVREPKSHAANSGARASDSNIATSKSSSSSTSGQSTSAKRAAPDTVKGICEKAPRISSASFGWWRTRSTRDSTSEHSSTRVSSNLSASNGPSSPPSVTHKSAPIQVPRQPENRPITQQQLVKEVKGIYAGLVMVEKKCVEIDQKQSQTTAKLSNQQWQALIALHRTLLHEHHDFFLASQHQAVSPALRELATQYKMPSRMWRHGIHDFLELLRQRLPDSLEHMLSFVHLAYQMVGLMMLDVPEDLETWTECLSDLARYRTAIEEADERDREIWAGVTRIWYDRSTQLDWTACESMPDRLRRVLTDPDAVKNMQAFANEGTSSLRDPLRSNIPMTGHLDCGDYMNAKSRFQLQAALLSRECLPIVLDRRKRSTSPASASEVQKKLVLEAQDIASRHDWSSVPVDCGDTAHAFCHTASLLVNHYDFLRVSQDESAPESLRSLAKKYSFPERIWKDGLDSLLLHTQQKGSFEDMLEWLKFGYDYIEELQQAAPDLESDWNECRIGLDFYRCELVKEMQRCLQFTKCPSPSSRHTSESCDKDFDPQEIPQGYDLQGSHTEAAPTCPGEQLGTTVSNSQDYNARSIPFDDAVNPSKKSSGSWDSPADYFDALEWPDNEPRSEDLRVPDNPHEGTFRRSILAMSHGKFLELREQVLKGWMVMGQVFHFNTFVKVYVILTSCLSHLC